MVSDSIASAYTLQVCVKLCIYINTASMAYLRHISRDLCPMKSQTLTETLAPKVIAS